jgi:2-methylcitrate dehydratase PrpD
MTFPSVTKGFVSFAANVTLDAVPDEALAAARLAILDWIGVTLAGSAEPLTRSLLGVHRQWGGERQATVVGHRDRMPIVAASLVNGAAAHALDFDDYLADGVIHATAPLVAGLLALAEARHVCGRDFLASYLVGYETHAHLSLELGSPLIHRGFHPTGVLTHLGVALAAGRMIGLDEDRLAMCLGVGATQAAGLLTSFGTMSKPLHTGKSATNGVLAALLVESGYTGSASALDGERGLPKVFADIELNEKVAADLGARWLIRDNAIKPYAACGAIHAAIDAATLLSTSVDPQDVDSVECQVSEVTCHAAGITEPTTGLQAKFSTQYAVASALVSGRSDPPDFTDPAVLRAPIQALLRRVTLVSRFERITEARVRVTRVDGTTEQAHVPWAKGSPQNPMTRDDVVDKFRAVAEPIIGAARADSIVTLVDELIELPDIAELTTLIGE